MSVQSRQRGSITSRKDFPGGLVVKTSPSDTAGMGSTPGWGAKIPHTLGPKNRNRRQKQ